MKNELSTNDRVINSTGIILENCAKSLNAEIISFILYGSRAGNSRNTQNDYEMIVLLGDNTALSVYIKFINLLRIELIREKLLQVKILVYTPDIFEDMLYNDESVGAFLYMICKESQIIYDKYGSFTAIRERIAANSVTDEENFIKQCIAFSKKMSSEKWRQKWEKTLMQYNYMKKRREY